MSDDLTPAQREAVTHPAGPLLVLAGAGSGKTRVLTRRLVWLVSNGVAPSSIVALAYNARAAAELRERAEREIAAPHETLNVTTFHAWARELLRVHGVERGLVAPTDPVGQEERLLLLAERRGQLDLHAHDLRRGALEVAGDLVRRIDKCRDNLITPAQYVAWAEERLRGASSPAEARLARSEVEFARVFDLHDRWLAELGLQDYGAMFADALHFLRAHPDRLEAVKEQTRHILVDEFQDTNFAQAQLLYLVAAGADSLVVVGDDDQGIYRFRGATTKNIVDFRSPGRFPNAREVVLDRNYRSHQRILDAANAVVAPIADRRPKRLVADAGPEGPAVRFWVAGDAAAQARAVAEEVARLGAGGTPYEEQAVLMRSVRTEAERVVEALHALGIPHQVHGGLSLFDRTEVRIALGWLRAAIDPADAEAHLRIVADPAVAIAWSHAAAAIMAATKEEASVTFAVCQLARESGANGLADRLEAVGRDAVMAPVDRLVTTVLDTSGLRREAAAEGGAAGAARIASLQKLEELAEGILRRNPQMSAAELVAGVTALAGVRASGAVGSAGRKLGVQVMTIHQAKGLEFDAVFVVGMGHRTWPGRYRRESDIPDQLVPEELPSGRAAHEAEARRLAYVALTRARGELIVSAVADEAHARTSVFYEEARAAVAGPEPEEVGAERDLAAGIEQVGLRRTLLEEATLAAARAAADDESSAGELRREAIAAAEELIDAQAAVLAGRFAMPPPAPLRPATPEGIGLSPNGVVTYLTCPLRYRYGSVDRIRTPDSAFTAIGTAAHGALQAHYRPEGKGGDGERLVARFEQALRQAGILDTPEAAQAMERARAHLPAYHQKVLAQGTPARVEYPFTLPVGPHVVRGRIDRIDRVQGGFRIVDYKTAMPAMRPEKEQTVLALYTAGLGEQVHVVGARLDYILDGEDRPLETTEDVVVEAVATARRVGDLIAAGAFEPSPGWHCNQCPFHLICPAQDRS